MSHLTHDHSFAGDLSVEEEVLQWLITQRTEDRIELITRVMLETSVEETQYLAVYFSKLLSEKCLMPIDDETVKSMLIQYRFE